MSGWQKSMNEYVSQCPLWKAKFVPKLNLFTDSDHNSLCGREGFEVQWLPPSWLLKEYTNCVSQRGENIILKEDFRKDHNTIFWNLIFYFKLLKLPWFFLDNYYNPAHIFMLTEHLEPYMPLEGKKKGSTKTNKSILGLDALSKLNEATIEHKFDLGPKQNRPPSLYEGMMGGGFGSDSIGVDTLSQTDSVVKPRRPGSVVNFGGRGSSAKRQIRGGSSQRSGSESQIGSITDLERIDQLMTSAPNANKYIMKLFGKYWEEFRGIMKIKNQNLLLSEINFDELPQELTKQVCGVAPNRGTIFTDTQSEVSCKLTKEISTTYKADDIISGLVMNKIPSTQIESQKFKPPPGNIKILASTGARSPKKTIKKSALKMKKSIRNTEGSIEHSEYESSSNVGNSEV